MSKERMSESIRNRSLWYSQPGHAEIRDGNAAPPKSGEVLVRTEWSAISRGTERLIWSGGVPETEHDRMRAPHQEGTFAFPVKYGYALVGRIENDEARSGQRVFVLHPHQDRLVVRDDRVAALPEEVPSDRACLAANMETALNSIWDSGVSAGERVAVIGAGVVGVLVGYLAGRFPETDVTLVDIDESRAEQASALGLQFSTGKGLSDDFDHVFHASGHPSGLDMALSCAGMEATITELSWYGSTPVSTHFGGAFHAKRLTLASSQVGTVARRQRARWNHRRRLNKALDLLKDDRLDCLLEDPVGFEDLPGHLPDIFDPNRSLLCPLVRYPNPD